jgi:membrane-bound lytic murein transglycosylase A
MRARLLTVGLAAWVLAGCATVSPPRAAALIEPSPPETVTPSPSEPSAPQAARRMAAITDDRPGPFAGLYGWAQDDHLAAFRAFVAGCGVTRDPDLAAVCRRASGVTVADEESARTFLESNFRPLPMAEPGLLTAYFTPVYEARDHREGDFSAPLLPRPADLPRAGAGNSRTYADRSEIEARASPDALAWLRPEDLFFLQIQGSGVLAFPDGAPRRAVFDGSNGAPFLGLAAPMRRLGLLPDQNTSAERIHAWLAANRGPRAEALMRLDRRYVFFRLEADDGMEPSGAAGRRLVPGRAVAVDPASHAMGEVLWIDAAAPSLSGAMPAYRRLAMALDTGGAIKGESRADLYLGRGPEAGAEAGRVRHVLRLYRLSPVNPPPQ